MATIIRGNRTLAKVLGVHYMTVQNWRKNGVLKKGTVAEYGKVIIYDLDKVLECLHHTTVKRGRRAAV